MKRNEYTKSQLFLLEFIIVVFFFAICVTVSVSAFVKADSLSEESRIMNNALIIAQSAAEQIKAGENVEDGYYNEDFNPVEKEDAAYSLTISKEENDGMLCAVVAIMDESATGEPLCELTIKKYCGE